MTWSCRSGAWFAVLGEHSLVALPPSEKARVAAIWALVDDGAGFDETLDALISSGLRDLPGFVLVCRDGDETRVVLRGEAHAHFTTADEVVRVDGEAATTWVERTLHGVQHLLVRAVLRFGEHRAQRLVPFGHVDHGGDGRGGRAILGRQGGRR